MKFRKNCVLIGLLVFTLLALSACSMAQSNGEGQDIPNQPVPTSTGENSQMDENITAEPETTSPDEYVDSQTPSSSAEERTDDVKCPEVDPHPIGKDIAETFDVSYELVVDWFCSGFSFENILIALETSEAVDIPAETLLDMLLEMEWEEIWIETGFVSEQ